MTQDKQSVNLQVVTNPYPAWQGNPPNCWVCYITLWNKEDADAHLCWQHQQSHIAEEQQI